MRSVVAAVLSFLCILPACAARTSHLPSTLAADASRVQKSVKALVQVVALAESGLTPAQKADPQVARALDQFYLAAYAVGARGEQVADLLVAYEAADPAGQATIADRVQAVLVLLQSDLLRLTGVNLGPLATSEVIKLVQNVNAVVAALQRAAAGVAPPIGLHPSALTPALRQA